jgi:hypothetical protein
MQHSCISLARMQRGTRCVRFSSRSVQYSSSVDSTADTLASISVTNTSCCTAALHTYTTRTHNSADDLDDTKGDRARSSGSGFASGSDGEGLGTCSLILHFTMCLKRKVFEHGQRWFNLQALHHAP